MTDSFAKTKLSVMDLPPVAEAESLDVRERQIGHRALIEALERFRG